MCAPLEQSIQLSLPPISCHYSYSIAHIIASSVFQPHLLSVKRCTLSRGSEQWLKGQRIELVTKRLFVSFLNKAPRLHLLPCGWSVASRLGLVFLAASSFKYLWVCKQRATGVLSSQEQYCVVTLHTTVKSQLWDMYIDYTFTSLVFVCSPH